MRPFRYLVVTYHGGKHISEDHEKKSTGETYRFVLLFKVVDVSVQNLGEQLDSRGRLHARVCHAQRTLQAF